MTATRCPPPAWPALERALVERRPVQVSHHGGQRVVCPHALGWKNGRAKVLADQITGDTSRGALPLDPRHRWRSLFVDEIRGTQITDHAWGSADNYAPYRSNGIDAVAIAVPTTG